MNPLQSSTWSQALLAIAASAALYYFGTGLYPLWPLAWFAPLPVLFVALRHKWWIAAMCAFFAFTLGRLNLFDYAKEIGGGSIGGGSLSGALSVMVLAALIPAVAFTLVVLLARYATLKLPGWLSLWVFPAALTSYEFAASANAFTGSLFSIAYSQTDFLPVVQVASLVGVWGITFLVSLLPSALATPWRTRGISAIAPAAIVILAALLFGVVRLQASDDSERLRVGLVASDAAYKLSLSQTKDDALGVVGVYAKPVHDLAAQGARIVLLPEKIVGFLPENKQEAVAAFGALASGANVSLIVGASENTTPRRNLALVFASDGKVIAEYAKHHLVPGIEAGYEPGASAAIVELEGSSAGITICKDNDFPPWLRRYGAQGVRSLFVPALDFDLDDRLHSRIR